MQESNTQANPFALMIDPQAVLQAVEQSMKLSQLNSRICRPLDGPANGKLDDRFGAEPTYTNPRSLGRN